MWQDHCNVKSAVPKGFWSEHFLHFVAKWTSLVFWCWANLSMLIKVTELFESLVALVTLVGLGFGVGVQVARLLGSWRCSKIKQNYVFSLNYASDKLSWILLLYFFLDLIKTKVRLNQHVSCYCAAISLRRTLQAIACLLLSPFQCFWQLLASVNILWQNGHSNFGGKWLFLRCWLRALGLVNLPAHSSHSNGFAPVWVFMCSSLSHFKRNILGQKSHLKLGGLWILRWWWRVFGRENDFEQSLHLNGFSFVCEFKW